MEIDEDMHDKHHITIAVIYNCTFAFLIFVDDENTCLETQDMCRVTFRLHTHSGECLTKDSKFDCLCLKKYFPVKINKTAFHGNLDTVSDLLWFRTNCLAHMIQRYLADTKPFVHIHWNQPIAIRTKDTKTAGYQIWTLNWMGVPWLSLSIYINLRVAMWFLLCASAAWWHKFECPRFVLKNPFGLNVSEIRLWHQTWMHNNLNHIGKHAIRKLTTVY